MRVRDDQRRGRDIDFDETAFEPFEDYLIFAWPDPPSPDTVILQNDRYSSLI